MSVNRIWLYGTDVAELNLPLKHELVKRGLYLGYGKSSIYAILHGNGPLSADELIELSDEMGYQQGNMELIYADSPDI